MGFDGTQLCPMVGSSRKRRETRDRQPRMPLQDYERNVFGSFMDGSRDVFLDERVDALAPFLAQ